MSEFGTYDEAMGFAYGDIDLCDVAVRKANEDSQLCGLEQPCPVHEAELQPRPQRVSAALWTRLQFGEVRDV